jgi:hypothetical protein
MKHRDRYHRERAAQVNGIETYHNNDEADEIREEEPPGTRRINQEVEDNIIALGIDNSGVVGYLSDPDDFLYFYDNSSEEPNGDDMSSDEWLEIDADASDPTRSPNRHTEPDESPSDDDLSEAPRPETWSESVPIEMKIFAMPEGVYEVRVNGQTLHAKIAPKSEFNIINQGVLARTQLNPRDYHLQNSTDVSMEAPNLIPHPCVVVPVDTGVLPIVPGIFIVTESHLTGECDLIMGKPWMRSLERRFDCIFLDKEPLPPHRYDEYDEISDPTSSESQNSQDSGTLHSLEPIFEQSSEDGYSTDESSSGSSGYVPMDEDLHIPLRSRKRPRKDRKNKSEHPPKRFKSDSEPSSQDPQSVDQSTNLYDERPHLGGSFAKNL